MDINTAILQGILAGFGLIFMVGSQDIFILRQGIKGHYVFLVTTITVLADAFLVLIGVNGIATFIQEVPFWQHFVVLSGAVFLFGYGVYAFYEMFKGNALKINFHKDGSSLKWWRVVVLALTFNILNPHAWLDAAVILGGLGSRLPTSAQHHAFAFGSILVISLWFYLLAYGAKWLAPLLNKPHTWQILNFFVGCIMWAIAIILLLDYWS